jgi:NAD(P)H-dependent flavin oxidoreductase YrpB (nitropropane dioxygenase family)
LYSTFQLRFALRFEAGSAVRGRSNPRPVCWVPQRAKRGPDSKQEGVIVRTEICERLGIEVPIFAFTHCRDVVVEVSRAGGLGVLGAVGFSAEQLAMELDWIDEHVGDKPYGVDTVIPQKYEGIGEMDAGKLEERLEAMIPREHREFAEKLLREHGVPEWPDDEETHLLGWTEATGIPLVEEALRHEQVALIANALGTPPESVIETIHESGRLVAALCGRVKQALRHKEAGVDIVIAQGSEAGGHTGEVGSIVLWPQIIDAVAPTPVLAAGGIGNGRQMLAAMAMGAQGVWTGSLWVAVAEAEAEPAEKQSYYRATCEDTVRSRSWTGKPARYLRNTPCAAPSATQVSTTPRTWPSTRSVRWWERSAKSAPAAR